jgi:hypothetical protein
MDENIRAAAAAARKAEEAARSSEKQLQQLPRLPLKREKGLRKREKPAKSGRRCYQSRCRSGSQGEKTAKDAIAAAEKAATKSKSG